MTFSRTEPFCDWLSVTCSPTAGLSFLDDVERFLNFHGYPISFEKDGRSTILYHVGKGTLKLESSRLFHSSSASGSTIREFESRGIYRDYVNVLGSFPDGIPRPHNVTRLDVAVDVMVDAPLILRELESRYPLDRFGFGRKAQKITRLYSKRSSDGALTGTWYVGHKSSSRVTCRVYDKQDESLNKRSEVIPPLTRYELTFRKDFDCSLYDALMPESIFYTHASPALLPAPTDRVITPWEPHGLVPWESAPYDHDLDLQRFRRRLQLSPELRKLAELAAGFGDTGTRILLRDFEKLVNSALHQKSVEKLTG